MPYITKEARRQILSLERPCCSVGECNYMLYAIALEMWNENRCYHRGSEILDFLREVARLGTRAVPFEYKKYFYTASDDVLYIDTQRIIIRAARDCELEFYRCILAPYEDLACDKNGEVYRLSEEIENAKLLGRKHDD